MSAPLLFVFLKGKARHKMALAALGLASGLLWPGCYSLLFRAPAHVLADKPPAVYTLTVTDFPTSTSRGAAFPARLHLEGAPDPQIQVYADAASMDLQPGQVVSVPLSLSRSDHFRGTPTDYYRSKGIYLLGYARNGFTLLYDPVLPPARFWPQYAAHVIKASLQQSFPDDISGLSLALITGDKSQLPTGLYSAFRRAGLAHVVAVSGLHISVLAGAITFFFGRRKRVGAVLVLVAVFFFAALAGNSPSALRAAFMCGVVSIAPLVGREEDKPTTFSAALAVILLQCPYAAASIGLQLSFASIAGIHLIAQPLNARWTNRIPNWNGPLGKLARKGLFACTGTLSVSLGAMFFTAPLAALHFHSVSLAGPISNLLALPVASVAFLGSLCTGMAGLICPNAASVMGHLIAWPARWMIFVAKLLSRLPFSALSLQSGYMLLWFLASYVILLLWLSAAPKPRPSIPLAALLFCLCSALLVNVWPTFAGTLTITALDVGQGASTLFISKGRAVLIDCGGNRADDPGDIAADALQALGRSKLDALILTHFHSDHTNGVAELLERIDVSTLIVPKLAEDASYQAELLTLAAQHNCEVELLTKDAVVTFGNATFHLYAPLGSGGGNEEGLSVLCSAGDFDALITGDMNDTVERRLIKYHSLPDIELLFVGHHGSKDSTSEALLLAAMPEAAVISCGYNTYGHPAPETLERLGAAGCDIYRTDLMGNITFTVKEETK